jgi:hypothetical protein
MQERLLHGMSRATTKFACTFTATYRQRHVNNDRFVVSRMNGPAYVNWVANEAVFETADG